MNAPLDSLLWVLILTVVLCTYGTDGQDVSCNEIQCENSHTISIKDVVLESENGNNCNPNKQQKYLTLLKKNCDGSETCNPLRVDNLPDKCICQEVPYTCTGTGTAGATQYNGSNVTIGVTVALLVVIGISVLVFCFVLHRRKRNARNQDSQTSDTDKNLFFYIDLVCGCLTKPCGLTTSPEATNVRHSDAPNNGYSDIKDVEENIYNEPTDIEPDVAQNNDTQYNRIQFQGPEIVLDPRYGRLNSKEIPKQDPQYSHVTETGFKEKSSQYSHITGAFSNSSSDVDGQPEPAHPGIQSADDTYNHTDNRGDKSTIAPSDEDPYSHLGNDNNLNKSKTRMVKVGATSDMNNEHLKPYPGTVEQRVVLNSPESANAARYSLAKPLPNEHNLADLKGNSSHYEVAIQHRPVLVTLPQ